jgi:dienelactone hydrolase
MLHALRPRWPRPNLDPRRLDRWGVRRRVGAVAAFVVVLFALVAVWPTVHVWLRATAFTADVVFRLPVRPLTWVTGDPSTERLDYAEGGYGLLTLPAGDEPAPGLIIVLGADAAKPDDARVVRLTDGLARIGFAVLLTQSEELDAALVLPIEIERLVLAFAALAEHPRLRADAIGYFGLSAGGSLVMVAASDPRIAPDVAYVVALGPYYDAASLAAAVLSSTYRDPAGLEPWEPEEISGRAIRTTLLHTLPEADRAAIESADEDDAPQTEAGRAVAALLAGPTIEQAEALLASLDEPQRALLDGISPSHAVGGLEAPLYLLHDRNDAFVPWTESEALAAVHEPAVYHRLDLFEHVDPQPGNVRYVLRDGWRLLRLFVRIIDDAG